MKRTTFENFEYSQKELHVEVKRSKFREVFERSVLDKVVRTEQRVAHDRMALYTEIIVARMVNSNAT